MKTLKVDEAETQGFWDFIAERQRIWYRREILTEKPPWTQDAVLMGNHFTNVYRQLDPGTQFAVRTILQADKPRSDKLFNLMVFRLIGKEESYEAHGWLDPFTFKARQLAEPLLELRDKKKVPPFTAAYMVCGYGDMGFGDKVKNVAALVERLADNWTRFWATVQQMKTRAEIHDVLSSPYGWGRFLAYQVLVDASYPYLYPGTGWQPGTLNVWEGDGDQHRVLATGNWGWVTLGPGAYGGMRRLFPGTTRRDEQTAVGQLTVQAGAELRKRGFAFLLDQEGLEIPLDHSNIANCLCEYDKYCRYHLNGRAGRGRIFRPIESYKADRIARGYGSQLSLLEAEES